MTAQLPMTPDMLGRQVIATHPDGHRLVGQVDGIGTRGISMTAPTVPARLFLAYERGWAVELVP